ncbi:uncharacterized protein KY384_000459 [Bacidia gigantensis]|uniref:uncharacterized protein n=1 Tax=Bacidia gigantensis TaxID=2732470 RepID=UPI001D05AFCB|nr:uncharacterized protein KY384_000459 [Bacidia gigantensis]KAG8525699.1 hypothetical protein KY384_000459 [Bacidia gigantensis]
MKTPAKSHLLNTEVAIGNEARQQGIYDVETFRDTLPKGHFGPFVAVVLLALVFSFLIALLRVAVPIKHPGSLSNTERALYVTGTTILASCIATYVGREIKLLWTRIILRRSSDGIGYPSREDIAEMRTLLGLGTLPEQFRFWSTTGALLMIGLLTTAMVAGVTPYVDQVNQRAWSVLFTNGVEPCFYASDNASND